MSKKVPRRPLTEPEKMALECLRYVRMLPASWEKRFRNRLADNEHLGISEKETPHLWRLFYRYRRQITHEKKKVLLQIAEDMQKFCQK